MPSVCLSRRTILKKQIKTFLLLLCFWPRIEFIVCTLVYSLFSIIFLVYPRFRILTPPIGHHYDDFQRDEIQIVDTPEQKFNKGKLTRFSVTVI